MNKMKLWEQLFSYEEKEIDYVNAAQIFYFYNAILKVKVGDNPVGSKFDQISISPITAVICLENHDSGESRNTSSASFEYFKLKLTIDDE